jgi:hypothetical protein
MFNNHQLGSFLFLLFFSGFVFGQNQGPIDKKATRETVNLYKNLAKIADKGFLFGHQDDLAYGVGWKYIDGKSDIKEVTGDYPAVYGWELGRLELDSPRNLDGVPFEKIQQFIREGYERGGVITISWHLNNPLTGKTAWQPAAGTVASILPGGEKHELYKSWLDKIAVFLGSLKGSHHESIPVILRLFHELNGNWFWWGGKNCTAEESKQLWRFTISYLRDNKKLHNLLYAYNTDRFGSGEAYLEKYPGDDWIDILGFDIYQRNAGPKQSDFLAEFDRTLFLLDSIAQKKSKVPALTEFGYNGLPDSSWWTGSFLKTIRGHRIAYALAWRNAGAKKDGSSEFYVPYPGQVSAADFREFYLSGKALFQKEATLENMYR